MIAGITEEDEEEEVVDDDEEDIIEEVDQFGPELSAVVSHDDQHPSYNPATPASPFVVSVNQSEFSDNGAAGLHAAVKEGAKKVPLTAAALAQMEEEEEAKEESAAAAVATATAMNGGAGFQLPA